MWLLQLDFLLLSAPSAIIFVQCCASADKCVAQTLRSPCLLCGCIPCTQDINTGWKVHSGT